MRQSAIVVLSLLLSAAGCKRGGSGAADVTPPVLVSAVFVGAGATPVAGDTLRLFFSEAVQLIAGRLLTDADLAFAAAGSLGDVAAPPTQVDIRTISIVLGSGVDIAPGVTAIAFAAANDAVADAAGNLGRAGATVVVSKGDGDAPIIGVFTASDVDVTANGTGSAGGTLQVPTTGFTIDLTYSDTTSNVDPAATQLTANRAVAVNGQSVAAGSNLVPHLQASPATTALASYTVSSTVVFPIGDLGLTAIVADSTGMLSAPRTLTVRTVTASDGLRPFETGANPNQLWFLDTSRDLESYALTPTGGTTFTVAVTPVANGRPDLHDALALIGLIGPDPAVNDSVIAQVKIFTLLDLALRFAGANVSFTFTSPGAFGSASSVPYASVGFSQICIAGAPSQAGVLGLALFDPNNDSQNNDCLTAFQNSRLGVFVLTVLDNVNGLGGPSTTMFRQTYDPFRSEISGGQAIGANAQDTARLAGTLNDARQVAIGNAISRLSRFIAVVVAHETGHSMGLVKNGAMPAGLFGGDAANFPGSNSEHIRMPTSLFPLGSVNIMSPTLNFELALSANTAFNSLNRAYLRERVLYNR